MFCGTEELPPGNWEKSYCIFCCRSRTFRRPEDLHYGTFQSTLPPQLAEKWVDLHRDEKTQRFLQKCVAGPTFWDVCKLAPLRILRWFVSPTDANAILNRGEMFVLSSEQLQRLFKGRCGGTLLDIGAGSGHITSELMQCFDQVLVTEVSGPMVRSLKEKGFPVLSAPDLSGLQDLAEKHNMTLGPNGSVDCIALMNVLDRCDQPLTLLQDVRKRMTPNGRLLLAVVLPFRPFVEKGIYKLQPTEQLHLSRNATWELAVEEMWQKVLMPLGFKLEALARVPYLCQGDLFSSIYLLDDAIFVLSSA